MEVGPVPRPTSDPGALPTGGRTPKPKGEVRISFEELMSSRCQTSTPSELTLAMLHTLRPI